MVIGRVTFLMVLVLFVLTPWSARGDDNETGPGLQDSDRFRLLDAKGNVLTDIFGKAADMTVQDRNEGTTALISVQVPGVKPPPSNPGATIPAVAVVEMYDVENFPRHLSDISDSVTLSIDVNSNGKLDVAAFMESDPNPGIVRSFDNPFVVENGSLQDLTSLMFPGWFIGNTNTLRDPNFPPPLFIEAQSDSSTGMFVETPEPPNCLLLGIGTLGLLGYVRRRRKKAA
jgi:hypothetical protein